MTTLCMYVNTKPILGHKPEKEFLSLTIGITHIKKKKKVQQALSSCIKLNPDVKPENSHRMRKDVCACIRQVKT